MVEIGQEGVIKFKLHYMPSAGLPLGDEVLPTAVFKLNGWRTLCLRLGLIGQDPARYDGYGFGNISQRVVTMYGADSFLISGTQTGHIGQLTAEQYALVTACNPTHNQVWATGAVKPSSEAMTHAVLYELDASIGAVIHVHSPDLWHTAVSLNLPQTDPAVPYGTPAMAAEVARLFADTAVSVRGIFSMGGHEDGLVVFGSSLDAAGAVLTTALAHAWGFDV